MIEKEGFSVVAATSVTHRFSTPGSKASCWALEKRCTSSMKRTISIDSSESLCWACESNSRTWATPELTAESSTNTRESECAIILARVVLPLPGGPVEKNAGDVLFVPPDQSRQRRARLKQMLLTKKFLGIGGAEPDC
jgi:hypothetical protein